LVFERTRKERREKLEEQIKGLEDEKDAHREMLDSQLEARRENVERQRAEMGKWMAPREIWRAAMTGEFAVKIAEREYQREERELRKEGNRVTKELEKAIEDLRDEYRGIGKAVASPQKGEEERFRDWYTKQVSFLASKGQILNPNPYAPEQHYDYRLAWRRGAFPQLTEHGDYRWPDYGKLPGHPVPSEEEGYLRRENNAALKRLTEVVGELKNEIQNLRGEE
jgi:hypothetical protein